MHHRFWFRMVTACALLGTAILATSCSKPAESKDPTSACFDRGKESARKGDHDDAIKEFSEAIRLRPSAESFGSRAMSWDAKGSYDEAVKDYTEAINRTREERNFDQALYRSHYFRLRGRIYQKQKKLDAAISDYSEAILLDPDNFLNYFCRSWAYQEKAIFDSEGNAFELHRLADKDYSAAKLAAVKSRHKNAGVDLDREGVVDPLRNN